jgi:hypothetical protein
MRIAHHRGLYEGFDIFMGSPPSSALMARNIATGCLEYKRAGPRSTYDTLSRYNGMEVCGGRRFFVSQNCKFGWVPLRTEVGDRVCVFWRMRIPAIMRP